MALSDSIRIFTHTYIHTYVHTEYLVALNPLSSLDVRNTAMGSCLCMCLLCLWCLSCHMQMLKWTSVHLSVYMIDGLGPKVVAIFVAKITLNHKA